MFKSIIQDSSISMYVKMHHLQNSVTGKAKTVIERYRNGGESYGKALEELGSRFGKPSFIIKANLDKLRKCNPMQDDKQQGVRTFKDTLSKAVWTLTRLGYESDLGTEANLFLVTRKLSKELLVKWKEHIKSKGLLPPNLTDFATCLKERAEI